MEGVDRRPVLRAAYLLALLVAVTPLAEVATGAWPYQPGELSWRFGVGGALLKTVMTPLLGVLIAMGAAAALGHRRVLRALAVVCFAAAAATAVAAVLFVLQFQQMRVVVDPALGRGMATAALTALVIAGLLVPAAAWMGVCGWKATRRAGTARARDASRANGMLVTPRLKENVT